MPANANRSPLASLSYGNGTILGPRQCAILHDMARIESMGESMTRSYIRIAHGVDTRGSGSTWSRLRARGLVCEKRGDRVALTAKGRAIASDLLSCKVRDRVGLVYTGMPH